LSLVGLANSRAPVGGVSFRGATTGARITHATGVSIGTNNLALRVGFRCPASNPSVSAAVIALSGSATVGNSVSAFNASINTAGNLIVVLRGASSTGDFRRLTVSGLVSRLAGRFVDLLITRAGNTVTIYINGVAATATEDTGGTPPVWGATVDSTYLHMGVGNTTSDVFSERIYHAGFYNYAPGVTEVNNLIEGGYSPMDRGANQTALTSGLLTRGKRYRIDTYNASDDFTNVGAASNGTGIEFVATGTTPTTWTASSSLRQIGTIVESDLQMGVGLVAHDLSNIAHGLIAGGLLHGVPQRYGQVRGRTNTNGNQQLLGGAVLPANARILSIVASVASGTPTVQLGNASGGAQLVASVMLATGRNDLTLVARYSTTGGVWVNANGTMNIDWTISYEMMD
jgi:hypothetical protein